MLSLDMYFELKEFSLENYIWIENGGLVWRAEAWCRELKLGVESGRLRWGLEGEKML